MPDTTAGPVAPDAATTATRSMDLLVEGLSLRARVGVYAAEQGRTQPLLVDLSVRARVPVVIGGLADTLDYEALARTVEVVVAERHVGLLEVLADRIAARLFADPRVEAVNLTLRKPEALEGTTLAGVRASYDRASPLLALAAGAP
jgi:dihydroneopterin aldolase